jgi:hypothetical protein
MKKALAVAGLMLVAATANAGTDTAQDWIVVERNDAGTISILPDSITFNKDDSRDVWLERARASTQVREHIKFDCRSGLYRVMQTIENGKELPTGGMIEWIKVFYYGNAYSYVCSRKEPEGSQPSQSWWQKLWSR